LSSHLFAWDISNFKLSEHDKDISSFVIPQSRSVKLVQWGGDWAGNKLELDLKTAGGVDIIVHSDKLSAASTLFTLVGRIHYATGKISAFVAGSGQTQRTTASSISASARPRGAAGYHNYRVIAGP